MTEQKWLTFVEASCIITGYGVDGGIMAVPFLAAQNGLLVTLLIALAGAATFLSLMRLVGGGISVVVALLLIPAYRASRRNRSTAIKAATGFDLGLWGSTLFQAVTVAAYLLSAAGSFIGI